VLFGAVEALDRPRPWTGPGPGQAQALDRPRPWTGPGPGEADIGFSLPGLAARTEEAFGLNKVCAASALPKEWCHVKTNKFVYAKVLALQRLL